MSKPYLESDVKRALKKFLAELGCYQFWPVQTGYGIKTVDVLFCYKGHFCAVECKRPEVYSATAYQYNVVTEVIGSGGRAWLENDPQLLLTKLALSALV